jgi:predicted dehydrogenase
MVGREENVSGFSHIGLWGCGNMGSSLARALAATGEASLSAVYDSQPEAASLLADTYGARACDSAGDLLAHPGLEGVIIALPPYLHAASAVEAAEAGLHIFVEKPMALDTDNCRRMISAAERCGVKLMVGHVLRYYEPYRSILRWTAEQRFGALFAASVWRVTTDRGFAISGHWRGSRAQSGGYLFEVSVHELDMLRCLMGQPHTIYALRQKHRPRQHEIEDYVSVQVRFVQGGVACYEGGSGSYVSRYGFRLYYEGATLTSEAAFDPRALQIHRDGSQTPYLTDDEFSSEHPVQAELRLWLAALRDEAPVPISGQEGLATVALVEAAYRSAYAGQPVVYEAD